MFKELSVPFFVKNPGDLKELVDKEMGISEWSQITQEPIDQFANATEDQQWIHVDGTRA
jgi:acyl dehydratase